MAGMKMRRCMATVWRERMRDDLLKRMSPTEIDKGEQTAKEIAATIKPAKS